MKTQISNSTYDILKRYSGVYQQMGRPVTDADWNEMPDIVKHRLADALSDVIGNGTPRDRGVVRIIDHPDGSQTYDLRWGYVYADGIIAQVRPDPAATLSDPLGLALEYEHQADFPQAPAQPAADHTVYVDVWERTVTALEDSKLRDPGLHGADTCTRTQTMAQVKWCPTTLSPENPDQNPTIGDALLTLAIREGSTEPDPCDPCDDEVALQDKVGNYLFRVEVHDVEYDAGGDPARIVLKWSSENGAEQYAVDNLPTGFASGNFAYEFYSGPTEDMASEKHLGKHLAPSFSPVRGALTKGYPDTEPSGFSLVRRWDGFAELLKSGTDWTLVDGVDRGTDLSTASGATAHGHVAEGATVAINLDAINMTIELADHQLLAGDFWFHTVREAVDVAGTEIMSAEPPRGILHHYLTLGTVSGGVFTAFDGEQCKRFEFPPLTDIQAKDICTADGTCDQTDIHTVQDAIDYLCRERDLRWHNKHLHGWGVVCGLIAECGPDTLPDPDGEGGADEALRREVRVSPGYALSCEGVDLVLEVERVFDLLARIEQLEESGTPVLTDGNGRVCLRIDQAENGQPVIAVEPYDEAKHKKSVFDGTLLMDFYEDCIKALIDGITAEFQFLNGDELDIVEGGATGLVSTQRRKFTSLLNLIVQFVGFNKGNGSYVFLSHKEHLILRDIYLRLLELLQSKTFCAMFQEDEFPDYPFAESGMTTYFGKNSHTRARLHPDGERVYTYGGTDNTINVYDVASEQLIQVVEMPAAEGAEVSAIAFSPDGALLYAAAILREVDSVFGIARIGDDHAWEEMTILCNIEITEMQVSADDPGLIYALGRGTGLYFLRPDVLMDETKAQPVPTYAFNASGHMALDEVGGQAFCTSQSNAEEEPETYDSVAICNLAPDAAAENLSPSLVLSLADANGAARSGSDGLALRPADADGGNGRLFVVVDGAANTKQLLTYTRPIDGAAQQPMAVLSIEDTQVSLAYHSSTDRLLLAMEDGYRLQLVSSNGEQTEFVRIPVQIQPVDVIVDGRNGQVYALNFISNTISAIPANELNVSEAFLDQLTQYRSDVMKAFFGLAGELLQYLKDCFCHHLLVKCPTCGEDEAIYLATVEIRNNQIYNICNFDQRKYVKSFPTMEYWFSLIPIAPLVKSAIAKLCCAVLPDFFGQYEDDVIGQPQVGLGHQTAQAGFLKASYTRQGVQTYKRTDTKALVRTQTKGLKFTSQLAGASAVNMAEAAPRKTVGVRKQAFMNSPVNDAVKELEKNQVQVVGIQKYDSKKANTYMADYLSTPQRIEPGSKVTLYQKDNKVMFYAVEKPVSVEGVEIPESVKAELGQLESRKAALADFSQVNAELEMVQKQRSEVAEFEAVRTELTNLQAEKTSVEEELTAMKSEVDAVKAEREALAQDITTLKQGLTELDTMRKEISLEIAKDRPVKEVSGVGTAIDTELRELGIRTVGELAEADPRTLTATGRIKAGTAEKIIAGARKRLTI
jgi:predicted flap endonuclease-1-like 5' DNA nuclease